MKKRFAWASALTLAGITTSQTQALGVTNGLIVITSRTASDALYRQISSSTLYDADDYRGPGVFSPGDTAMAALLQENGYSTRLVPEWLLSHSLVDTQGVYSAALPAYFAVAPNYYGLAADFIYGGGGGPTKPGDTNNAYSASLVIISGSGSAFDMPPPNTNGIGIIMGEHTCIGDRSLNGKSSIYMYSTIRSVDVTGTALGDAQYMKVLDPTHPILQGIPLDAQGRVKIWRDPYPEENAHVPSGGKANYQYSWLTVDLAPTNVPPTVAAPGTKVLGVLGSDPNRAVFAVMDKGGSFGLTIPEGPWSSRTTSPSRLVHFFANERGSADSRRAFSCLTDIGKVIFIRTCKWAMGEALQPYQGFGIVQITPPTGQRITNSIGMTFVRIPAGTCTMGYWQSGKLPTEILNVAQWFPDYGDYDEKPARQVTITRPFYLGINEVCNAEYERFDPGHRALRGKLGFSTNDNEAVVFVSWPEAKAFCDWLSAREGQPYRLPTEAEWEYSCRAGTTTHFWTGDTLPAQYQKNPGNCWYPDPNRSGPTNIVPLTVGQTLPNPWGLCDMHGNVEEWCYDWYGPYATGAQSDPVGRADGLARVTRGGSHSTFAFHLRSENRMGALPRDKSWYIGFRVALAEMPSTAPLPAVPPEPYQTNVSQTIPAGITNGPDPLTPFFSGPIRYVNLPANGQGPVYTNHNHDPSIIQCPNGDLLAIWYTTVSEGGRELAMAASRLRYGQTNWATASSFYDLPDRNDHAPAFYAHTNGTIYHFNGVSAGATWGPLAILSRFSTNNGADWSRPSLILPEHNVRHQLVPSVFRTSSGAVVLTADAVSTGNGGTAVHISRDGMLTWIDPGAGRPIPAFTNGGAGAWLAGIHGNIAELSDGRWLALGRGDSINGMMPKSVSSDQGSNWTYSASIFQPIGGGQRVKLLWLKEGPLFLASFCVNKQITDASGGTRPVSGLFGAISYDDGVTWPFMRLISDDRSGRSVETTDGELFTLGFSSAEPKGYLDAVQARNGVIHLISSRQHYQFNLKWLATRPPSSPVSP